MSKIILTLVILQILIVGCKKNSDDDNPLGGGNNDPVTITSTSPEYVFWGEELTINGTGFSSNAADNFVWFPFGDCGTNSQDSTDWKKAGVVSASSTKLIVKVPVTTQNGLPCSVSDFSTLFRLTVKNKPTIVSSTSIKPMGYPVPVDFCGWYGGGYISSKAIRAGDSVLMNYAGGGLINLHSSGNQSRLKFSINDVSIPFKLRPGVSGCGTYGISFKLPINEFSTPQCTPVDPVFGMPGQVKNFKLSIDGVQGAEVSRPFFIHNLPQAQYIGATGPTELSKSAGGNPFWTITGKNMTYHKVNFAAQSPCTGSSGEISTLCNSFCDEFNIYVPLSLLTAGCTYNILLINVCGATQLAGSVKIVA